MAVWRNFGTLMVIFLAGLQTIPREMLEAAEIDGASGWPRFRHITLPMLRPTLLFGAVITSIGYLQFFEEAFVMTQGGPLDATLSISFFTYDQFGFGNYGFAAAASYLLFLAIVLLTCVQFRLLRRRPEHEPDARPPPRSPGGRPRPPDRRPRGRRPARETRRTPALALRRPVLRPVLRGGAVCVDAALVVQARGRGQAVPPTWWPETVTTSNYGELFTRPDFPTYFGNSVVVAIPVTLGNLVFCSMLGYALAKLEFPGKRALFAFVLGTLMVPGMVTFIPQFVMVTNINLTNTCPGLILPFLVGPFGIFLMRQFILSLPDELIQAARIDGAGELRIFFSVILPLCGPALATLGDPDVPLVVEQLPLAAGDRPVGGQVHAAGRTRALLGRPERHAVRPAPRRLGRRRAPGARRLPGAAAPHHAGRCHDRHQITHHLHRLGEDPTVRIRTLLEALWAGLTSRRAAPTAPPPAAECRRGRGPRHAAGRTPGSWRTSRTPGVVRAMTDPVTGLPSDNIGGDLSPPTRSTLTSPTNMAYLWSTVVARDPGLIDTARGPHPDGTTIETVADLEKHEKTGCSTTGTTRGPREAHRLARERLRGLPFTVQRRQRLVRDRAAGCRGADPRWPTRPTAIRADMDFAATTTRRPRRSAVRSVVGSGTRTSATRCSSRADYYGMGAGRLVHRPPLRRLQHRAADGLLPRHRRGPDPAKHYFGTCRTFPRHCDWSWTETRRR